MKEQKQGTEIRRMKIFISYRRADNAHVTGRIYDKFAVVYGPGNVFKDVDSIPIGSDFKQEINKSLSQCDFLIVVIGAKWLNITDVTGRRRLDNPSDLVRIEIESALKQEMRIIPLLVDDTTMPAPDELPEPLQNLAFRNGAAIRPDPDFHRDMDRVIRAMNRALSSGEEPPSDLPPTDRAFMESRKADVLQTAELHQEVIRSEKGGYELVRIPAGTFMMGSAEYFYDEQPVHEVRLSKFYMGRYPVTNEEYGRFLMENPDAKEPQYWNDGKYNQLRQPVVGVSWDDALQFAEWAEMQLPTEAQWEYACRAGTATRYHTGDSRADLDRAGWYDKNSEAMLYPVGQKEPNAWGLYDMHGNSFEWCKDWYRNDYYKISPSDNPPGPDSGEYKVFRGGSWFSFAASCRSAHRGRGYPDSRDRTVGFRLVKSIP